MDEKEITKVVLQELEAMGMLKRKNDTFKNTESVLYSYNTIKETIGQRKSQINDLKKYGMPKKSKSITVMSEHGIVIEENDLLDTTIKNIEKSIIKTKVILNYIDGILSKFQSDPYYDIIKLKYFDKKTHEEIAEHLQKDVSTVNRNKNRLVNEIKVYLMPNDLITDLLGY
ncbi:MAG: hypothetical protein MST00_03440 [Tenericutes bacterium]|jgi:predicted transcriptional regulator|nr:hypothetical protein [Mycoplasmatota bacterium]